MSYPNLIAEYQTGCCHISSLAEHANVTVGVMRAVLAGQDDLTANESAGVFNLYRQYGIQGDHNFNMDYLFADELTLIDTSNTSLLTEIRLCKEQIQPDDLSDWFALKLSRALEMEECIITQPIISYAAYRHCMGDMLQLFQRTDPKQPRDQVLDILFKPEACTEKSKDLGMEKLKKTLQKSFIPDEQQREILWRICDDSPYQAIQAINCFNYGLMEGKRMERAKKKVKAQ